LMQAGTSPGTDHLDDRREEKERKGNGKQVT
jgi:hypothetical protein